jgi:hypothetical protein
MVVWVQAVVFQELKLKGADLVPEAAHYLPVPSVGNRCSNGRVVIIGAVTVS